MLYYDKIDANELKKLMLSQVTGIVDKREGSFIYDSLSPVANEISQLYMELNETINKLFIETSYDKYLDMRGKEFGVYRKLGTKATGSVTITTNGEVSIIKGTKFSGVNDLIYVSTENKIVNGSATIKIEALEVGELYNIEASLIDNIVDISGWESILSTEIVGGTDPEDDDAFRERIFQRMKNPPGSGNKGDYERWAREIDGVRYAHVIPLWDGPQTVKVIVGGENGEQLDSSKVKEVQDYLDPEHAHGSGKAPIGAFVTVEGLVNKVLNITVNSITIEDEYELPEVKEGILKAVGDFMNTVAPGEPVRYHILVGVISKVDGIKDFDGLLLNGKLANATCEGNEKFILGVINYV